MYKAKKTTYHIAFPVVAENRWDVNTPQIQGCAVNCFLSYYHHYVYIHAP